MQHANRRSGGHLAALVSVVIWGTTFISTKVLLEQFGPLEILVIRFVIAYAALWAVRPRRLTGLTRRQELISAGAGLCGITLYYLLENIALTYTLAANVGVIVSVSPFFTALVSRLTGQTKRIGPFVIAGFILAMVGIALLSYDGTSLQMHLWGDLLALLAAFVWSLYSLLTREIASWGHSVLLTTRRVFFYGIIFLIPICCLTGLRIDWTALGRPVNLGNLLFLGLGASALCFVTWDYAIERLGAVRTSTYIYLVPVVTLFASSLLLDERLAPFAIFGSILTIAGLIVSEGDAHLQRRR